ncbi:MAG TPA: glycerol-3-phosphate 1-O-acyltransferase PlsB, partial [Steroidobacteraceae bacterium]|nr:glycerol-3-phosphate 1-O-acyltransferase PlsB [Steroidobacteraceae bacterium]
MTGRFLLPWLRFSVRPADVAEQLKQVPAPVCYVMGRHSTLDEMILQRACARVGLPRPAKRLQGPGATRKLRSTFALSRRVGMWSERLDRRPPQELKDLLTGLSQAPAFDVTLVPVAIYWGRAPQRERLSWFRLLLSEDWALASKLRRALSVVFNGRNTMVEFGAAVSMRSLLAPGGADNQAARRVLRHVAAQLAASRTAYVGPDLSHRRTVMTEVLRSRQVRALVRQEARESKVPVRQAMQQARAMFDEIAADYSHNFVQLMERVLRWLWTRIYEGVEVAHADTIASIASGNELVYVPCHRSTMDDLLMPYAIYSRGFAVPHIAAGINLNLPVVGPMLRKGGAFFMRRSFRGSPLYTAVFMKYLGAIMARGHPIQYFIEGGRSRTGRSLQPKTGMLSMTLRSFIRQPVRPVMFVPVYLGYERIMEIDSYVGEMSGKPKEKETLLGFLRSLKRLRENFGHVHVNIGEPIALSPLLDEHQPEWRDYIGQEGRGATVSAAVDVLAQQIMRNINAAAAVTPVNLLSLVLLAAERQALPEAQLRAQLGLCLELLRSAPYSLRVTATPLDADGVIAAGFKARILHRSGTEGIGLAARHAAAMTWYRNNVLHVFAMPSLLACCFHADAPVETAVLQGLIRGLYPYLAAEFFLHWEESALDEVVLQNLHLLRKAQLLRADG